MAGAEREAEDGGGDGRVPPGRSGCAARPAPLGPEQLRRVLEQVAQAQPPRSGLQDAVGRLREAAQLVAQQRGPGAEPPRPPRLLPPQPLKTICVKVTPGEMKGQERPTPQLATVHPPQRPCRFVGLSVAPARLLRALPLPSARPQLRSSPQPPVQVLVPRPPPALPPAAAKGAVAPRAPNGPGTALAPRSADPPAVPSVSSSSANVFVSNLHTEHTEKLKKPFKVKTRSGRISRPPKYKAKDYKFIRTEDLADSHASDSDDYSELSVEDEEEQRDKQALFDLPSCSLRPRASKCPACGKTYIGKGGLARHFRLNPGHGQPEPEPAAVLSEEANGSVAQGRAEGRSGGRTSPGPPAPALLREEGARSARGGPQNGQSVEVTEALVSEPADGCYSALLGSERHPGPERGCPTAPTEPGPAGQEQRRAARSRARLQEVLCQCARDDLVEVALPLLAQAVTPYEFLLVKVAKGHLAKPLFPAVYKEFEELHHMVKKMCHDYLRSPSPRSQEPLEVNDAELAESLGITEEFLSKKETRTDCIPYTCTGREVDGEEPEAASPRKRDSETAEEGLASAKRTRRAALPREPPESPAYGRGEQTPGCALAASEGLTPGVNGSAGPHPEEGHAVPGSDSNTSSAPGHAAAWSWCADPALSYAGVSGPGLHPQQPGPRTQQQAAAFPTEHAQGPPSDLHAGDSLGSRGPCSGSTSAGGEAPPLPGGSGDTEAGQLCQVPGSPASSQQPRPREDLLVGAAAPQLEKALSPNAVPTPTPCAHGTVSQPGRSRSPQGALGSRAGRCGTGTHADQRGLVSVLAVGEALAFEIPDGCQELLSQGQEQVFIQTFDGLILSHPGVLVSGGEDIVLLAGAEGPAAPEGLPLEPVEAEASQ